jgi:peptidyl-prolyl cis-trans isomerase C
VREFSVDVLLFCVVRESDVALLEYHNYIRFTNSQFSKINDKRRIIMQDKVLAVINGREITDKDLMYTISRFPRERQAYLASEEGRKQLLEQVISFELVYNYAIEKSMDKENEYIEQVENAKKEILTQYGISKILSQVSVTDQEVKNYYEENMSTYIQEEAVRAKHILVNTLDEAKEIKEKINAGLSFEEAAKQFSNCPSNAEGGDLGTFTRGRMVPEFENASFQMAVGEISEPIQTQFGYHLIKVEEKNEPSIMPLREVAATVRNNLIQEKQNQRYIELTEELKKKYKVEIR